MSMDQIITAFFDEFEKIAVSKKDSPFMQSRAGRRPIRAENLLRRESETSQSLHAPPSVVAEESATEHEYGDGMAEKLGERKKEPLKIKAIRTAVEARPWVSSGVKGAIPAAIVSNFLIPATSQKGLKYKSRIVSGAAALGAAAGVGDKALKEWAKKNPRTLVARELKKQSASTMRKAAAMAADLRMKGLGKVTRPPFATEDSKRFAFNQLKNSKSPGYFTTHTQPKHLRRPGPSIQQVAPTPGK